MASPFFADLLSLIVGGMMPEQQLRKKAPEPAIDNLLATDQVLVKGPLDCGMVPSLSLAVIRGFVEQ